MSYNKQQDNNEKFIIHQMLMLEDNPDIASENQRNYRAWKIQNGKSSRGCTRIDTTCISCGKVLIDVPPKRLRCKPCAEQYTRETQNAKRRKVK